MADTKIKLNSTTWSVLFCVWIAQGTVQILQFGWGMMSPGIMEYLGTDIAQMGMVGGIGPWFSVLLTIPVTILAGRLNPHFAVALVIIILAIGQGLMAFATPETGVTLLVVGNIIAQIVNLAIPTLLATVKVKAVPAQKINLVNGIENMVQPIGQFIATMGMTALLTIAGGPVLGWKNVFYVICGILILAAILYYIIYGNGSKLTAGINAQVQGAGSSAGDEETWGHALLSAWKHKEVWLTSIAWPFTTLVWIAIFFYFPYYAQSVHGLSPALSGAIVAMIPLFSAIASATAPAITSKAGVDKPFICIWGIILPIVYLGMIMTSSVPVMFICSAIAGYGAYMWVPAAFSNLYKLGLSQKGVTMAIGTLYSFMAIGSAGAGTVVGALINIIGFKEALILSCFTPVVFGILQLFVPEMGRKWLDKVMAAQAAAAAQ
ncbi:MAG: MFS transporter [Spirochaetaceae bacterium]|jgi:Na+/melibiose symporter-like transporter|nr:MFS transporter [Spirochaetaceae bacterium]